MRRDAIMSNTWNQLRSRSAVVHTIVTRAADGVPASAAWAGVDGVWQHFEDEGHLLRELQQRWFHSLTASVDNELEMGHGNLVDDVRRAYRTAADRHRGLRRILDEYAQHPALVPLVRREHTVLAQAAGVAHADEVTQALAVVPEQPRRLFARMFSAA
jgi:glycine/D-amino acid oxidase-like deaminating enzyme